jgi:hypothetical protein
MVCEDRYMVRHWFGLRIGLTFTRCTMTQAMGAQGYTPDTIRAKDNESEIRMLVLQIPSTLNLVIKYFWR